MAPPSDADGGAPLRGHLAVDATADATGRPAHHPVAHAAALPERRRCLMDLLRLVLRYVGDRVGQVLRLMVRKNLGEPGEAGVIVADKLLQACDGAGVVVDELHNVNGSDSIKNKKSINKSRSKRKKREDGHVADPDARNAGLVVADKLLQAHDGAGLIVDELHNINGPNSIKNKKSINKSRNKRKEREDGRVADPDARNAVTNLNVGTRTAAKKNHAYQYQNRRRRAIRFVMVGNYRVYKEQKDLYAMYCQERPSSARRQLCHMCISKQKYFENTFAPNAMLMHCSKRHVAGIECTEPGCRVRVYTEEERSLHIHFCHRLPAGWWDWKEYKELDK